jgi:hypothetical protein
MPPTRQFWPPTQIIHILKIILYEKERESKLVLIFLNLHTLLNYPKMNLILIYTAELFKLETSMEYWSRQSPQMNLYEGSADRVGEFADRILSV